MSAFLVASSVRAQAILHFDIGAGRIEGIAAGPDGNVWFTRPAANHIGRTTMSGEVTEFTGAVGPGRITAGPDGNLWFTEGSAIARITVEGQITHFPLPKDDLIFGASPTSIAAGPDGNVWFTLDISRVGRLSSGGEFEEFETHYNGLSGIATGPDGAMWFTTNAGGESKICRITTDGVLAQFGSYGALSGPTEIIAGPDGNLWFAEVSGKIGRITTQGDISEFDIGASASTIATWNGEDIWLGAGMEILQLNTEPRIVARFPVGWPVTALTRGPDGNLWFADALGGIGRIRFERRRSVRH